MKCDEMHQRHLNQHLESHRCLCVIMALLGTLSDEWPLVKFILIA